MPKTIIEYDHNISMAHRLFEYSGQCSNLHGHNYKISLTFASELNKQGMVVDFNVIKETYGWWLNEHWDHKTLLYEKDPWLSILSQMDCGAIGVPFNPTAENMARHIMFEVSDNFKTGMCRNVLLVKVVVEETFKCRAIVERKI